jgi:hypothetical protein
VNVHDPREGITPRDIVVRSIVVLVSLYTGILGIGAAKLLSVKLKSFLLWKTLTLTESSLAAPISTV